MYLSTGFAPYHLHRRSFSTPHEHYNEEDDEDSEVEIAQENNEPTPRPPNYTTLIDRETEQWLDIVRSEISYVRLPEPSTTAPIREPQESFQPGFMVLFPHLMDVPLPRTEVATTETADTPPVPPRSNAQPDELRNRRLSMIAQMSDEELLDEILRLRQLVQVAQQDRVSTSFLRVRLMMLEDALLERTGDSNAVSPTRSIMSFEQQR
jgi:hypothetical protein